MLLPPPRSVALLFAFAFSGLQASAQSPSVIRTQSEPDLIPEGIAYHPATGTLYVSSIARQKIIAIDSTGRHRDFISQGEAGYLEGLGMKIDTRRNLLWTLSNRTEGKTTTSRIIGFDLQTGRKKDEYTITDTLPRLLNDLVLDANGNLYITDTEGQGILFRKRGSRRHQWLVRSATPLWPNGITTGKGQRIYIASYAQGPRYIDPANGKLMPLPGYRDTAVAFGLDGLVYWKHTLIGIFNVGKTDRDNLIIQYTLNPAGNRIIHEKILDKGNPDFRDPTTAVLAGNTLYVLANSYLDPFNQNKQSTGGIKEKLGPVVVIKYTLGE